MNSRATLSGNTGIVVLLSAVILSAGVNAAEPAAKLVFACRADSDLYRVLCASGTQPPRYDTPAAAVAAAPDGAGVLVLADGYPAQTTAVPDAVFVQAKSKRLRLYVEYPAALPGLKCEAPRGTQTERAVVASDFFGRELGPGRILAINGLHFVPVAVEKSHLVAARVAGFDSAAFGLPKQTYPLLFEHPQGNLLIATTRLSQFVAGRYAPQDAWQTLWRGVLRWLAPDAAPTELKWTPLVRASYGRDDPLPADAEKQALRRGADWFIKSKLLLDRSRLGDDWKKLQPAGGLLAKHPSGLVPTPPPDAPVGDGSLGILEAPLSVIQPDGSQLQSVSRRGDCHGEAAMALAFGGVLTGDAQKTDDRPQPARLLVLHLGRLQAGTGRSETRCVRADRLGHRFARLVRGQLRRRQRPAADGYAGHGGPAARGPLGRAGSPLPAGQPADHRPARLSRRPHRLAGSRPRVGCRSSSGG